MSFLRKKKEVGLVGKTIRVGSYSVRVEALLGEGGFASVYRVQDVTTQKMLALKHSRMGADPEAVAHVKKEIAIMKVLRSGDNILTLRSVAFTGPTDQETEAFMVMDFCDGTLVEILDAAQGTLPDKAVLKIFADVCGGVMHMHSQQPPIAHRDLKAENVMVHSSGSWLLCDFGSATNATLHLPTADIMALAEDDIRRHTTPSHRAPELWDLYSRMPVDHRVDLWALGCLLYIMAYNKLPFPQENKLQVLNGDYLLPSSRGPAITGLVRHLLQVHPDDRPPIDVLLQRVLKALDEESSPMAVQRAFSQPQEQLRALSTDELQQVDGYSPALATFAAFDSAPKPPQQPAARPKPPPYMPKASPAAAPPPYMPKKHSKGAAPPPYMPRSQATSAAAPDRAPSPAQRPAPDAQAPFGATRSSSTPEPGRQRSAGGEQPAAQPGPGQRQGGAAPAGGGTVQQAQEVQQLRTQLAELQQRVRQAADSEAGLQAQLADARQEKDDAKRQADDARRQADDVRQRGDGAKDTQAQLEAAQQKQRQQADTIVQQRDLIRQLRDKARQGEEAQPLQGELSKVQREAERLSETVVKQRELIQQLRAKQGNETKPRAEQQQQQQEIQRLSETVVKQRELFQEMRAKQAQQQGGEARPRDELQQQQHQQEVERLTQTVVKQRELIQLLRAQQQDHGAERLRTENAQLTDTVVRQRELIQQLRAQQQQQQQHGGGQALPEQVGNGAPSWPTEAAQTTTIIEEVVDGHSTTIALEIFQHLTMDLAPRDAPPTTVDRGQQAQRQGSSEQPSSNPFAGSNPFGGGFESSTSFTPTKGSGEPKPQWQV